MFSGFDPETGRYDVRTWQYYAADVEARGRAA